jgi:hypothetical protein
VLGWAGETNSHMQELYKDQCPKSSKRTRWDSADEVAGREDAEGEERAGNSTKRIPARLSSSASVTTSASSTKTPQRAVPRPPPETTPTPVAAPRAEQAAPIVIEDSPLKVKTEDGSDEPSTAVPGSVPGSQADREAAVRELALLEAEMLGPQHVWWSICDGPVRRKTLEPPVFLNLGARCVRDCCSRSPTRWEFCLKLFWACGLC